tara:strand:- start:19 stop:642 length:624 start_codon:yes stop_codon:yes gene_type:complete
MEFDFLYLSGYELALILVLVGSLFDFFDGYFAKILDAKTKIGVQLDSFSDLITFSVTHSLFLFHFFQSHSEEIEFSALISFLIIPFSMIRLGRFNTLPSKTYFLGLPTPANGIFFMGIPFLSFDIPFYFFISIIFLSCILLISNIKFESFKSIETNIGKVFLLFFVLITLGVIAFIYVNNCSYLNLVSASVVIYVISSIASNLYKVF